MCQGLGNTVTDPTHPTLDRPAPAGETLRTLFDLGRQVTSVLEFNELLHRIPELIRRVIAFRAFAVYLLDEKKAELRIAYSVGYGPDVVPSLRLKVGEGLIGTAVLDSRAILVDDVTADARYVPAVPGSRSELVVPLVYKAKAIGALNILSERTNQFTEADVAVLRQFGTHVAVALVNARMFEREHRYAETFETLAEIGRDMTSILDLELLLKRVATLARRVIDYRTFGILLFNQDSQELELKVAVKYGQQETALRVKLGEGLVGYAAQQKEPVLVNDVTRDPRYIEIVSDVRSELVVPMLVKERCVGVFNLESPELGAFDKRDVEILTLLASQAAVAIENARLYEAVRANEIRLEREVGFAQRVQMALMPIDSPAPPRGMDVAASFTPARELGGDFYVFLQPAPSLMVVAVGDVSGKGVPAALYGAFAAELVRGRAARHHRQRERASPATVLASVNDTLYRRQLEAYYCALSYALFDVKDRRMVLANSGLPYAVRWHRGSAAPIELPGIPLGLFAGSTYDEAALPLDRGDVYAFCTDGLFETTDPEGREFGTAGLTEVLSHLHDRPAREIVEAILQAASDFRRAVAPSDDVTIVVVKIAH